MLSAFRQKGLTSAVYGAIIVATILVFILGFNPSAGKKLGSISEACAARVRGSCIDPKAYRAAYRLAFARGNAGMKQEMASRFVLEGLIERELLIGEAERLGLTVSEDEITDSIFHGNIYVSLPADSSPQLHWQLGFDNGRTTADRIVPNGFKNRETKLFDLKIYERTVKQLVNRSPAEFREWQTRELLAAKMRDLVRAPVRVAEDEAFDRYVEERSTSTINYVFVRKGWIEKYAISPADKDVEAWAKENPQKIAVPVRHILVKVDNKDDAAQVEAAKKKAQDLLDRIKKGEDFAALAKEHSEDPGSKDNGGQYPAEQVSSFVKEFQDSVAKLKPGEVDPNLVETTFGFHIIKRDPATKEDLVRDYKAAKSDDVAKAMAKDILEDLKNGKSTDDAIAAAIAKYGKYKPKAEKPAATEDAGDAGAPAATETFTAETDPLRPQVVTSSAFNRGGDPIPAISSEATEAIVKFAFEAKPNDLAPEPVQTDDGYIVVQLKEHKPATKEDFDKERDTYMLTLLTGKQNEALAYYVRRLREASKQEIKIDERHLIGAKSDGSSQDDEDD